ncbi:restriction endonuclease [Desulfolithobacter dissulfuricans]|uniref:Restriction endonuclease n=1 Tax=Desulfolithobacter dissulfuricans TaxID=2795293 RepID=A0A915U2B7_9BACT|nr:DEAD/DEAH box helicase [Desulfolithobacter dissulfuricans]BCO09894.1 restriction endonuclease [Desulfolithobacter dissulfuricans]
MIKPGLYEQLITEALQEELDQLHSRFEIIQSRIDAGESHSVLAQFMEKFLESLLSQAKGPNKINAQIEICNKLIRLAARELENISDGWPQIRQSGKRLLQIHDPAFARHPKPETPLSVSSLLTATSGDPTLVSQLKQEILHADHVDILVSFIKWSGIRIIKDELEEVTRQGRLRIITTSYLGATDLKAIEYLLQLPNTEVRVSFDTKRTRLHAKAYIFHRASGFGTSYIGSSNISNPAMTDGLEWNVKVCQYESEHLWEKINATFETYQLSKDFDLISLADLPRLDDALSREKKGSPAPEEHLAFFDITPYPFQQEILDKLEAERTLHNRTKNLVVAATGTGKTVIAAFDFKRFSANTNAARLLFVAHREEILTQARAVFRNILRDENFGELWVGNHTPRHKEQLFVSVQTFHRQELWNQLDPDFYDFIIIDEFHHAAASSYEKLTDYFSPKILLGLTATPERADGKDILKYFDGHISAEIRLPDAINRKLLSPFQYFCITDRVDYSQVTWRRGGYDKKELEALLVTGDDMRARLIINKARELLLDVSQTRGLCFCVSKEHAEYMAGQFTKHCIPALALTTDTPDHERKHAVRQLKNREINFLCVVDLFNEGVDIPEIDTVMFLRPTESLTVFLQQLGRGLRLCEGKDCLTVLDFIGQAHQKFNFEIRFRALLGQTARKIEDEVESSFPSLPSGCVIEMEKEAQRYILENIKKALTHANKNQIVSRIASFTNDTGLPLTLENFLEHHGLDLDDIYKKASWARLCALAGERSDFHDPDEIILSKGLRRFCHNNSAPQLNKLLSFLQDKQTEFAWTSLPDETRLLLTMFCFSIWNNRPPGQSLEENITALKKNPVLFAEAIQLIRLLLKKADTLVHETSLPFPCSLSVHACYTRDEILSGLGFLTFEHRVNVREGVKYLSEIKTDVFFITLNKTEKDYSPTTMYKDFALDETTFHWQSQSTTSDTSPTGQRYINHRRLGNHILLFVREHKKINGLACPYSFLGPATYDSHTGSKPMSIIWKLHYPMPGKLVRTTARLAVA